MNHNTFTKHLIILLLNIYMALFIFPTAEYNCSVAHVDQVLTAQEGDRVLLSCLIIDDQLHRALWYKQVLGEKPVLVVSSYHHSQPNKFYPDFEETHHFDAKRSSGSFNLTILRTLKSDSGTYFCAASFANIVSFGTGTILLVKGEDYNTLFCIDGLFHLLSVLIVFPPYRCRPQTCCYTTACAWCYQARKQCDSAVLSASENV